MPKKQALLAQTLKTEFDDNAKLRKPHEDRWLKDIRQDKGIYEPDVLAKIKPGRSQSNVRLTTVKKTSVRGRIMDLQFPINGEKNWGIGPTPIAEVDKMAMAQIYGVDPENKDELQDAAVKACEAMSKEMEDQLVGGVTQVAYRDVCRDVSDHAVLLGTGVLKGPLVERRSRQRWRPVVNTDNPQETPSSWELAVIVDDELRPYYSFVPLWDIYPDMSSLTFRDCRFIWETHLMTKHDLLDLCNRPLYDELVIRDHVKKHRDGDAELKTHEQEMRTLSGNEKSEKLKGRYRVYERWGYVSGRDLVEFGTDAEYNLDENQLDDEFAANIWMVGDEIIKAVVAPLRGVFWPYYAYYFRKDECSIFGEGVAAVLRDPQAVINGAVRMMLDAAAMSALGQWEINVDLLDLGEETDLTPHAGRVWKTRKGSAESAGHKAVDYTPISSKTQEYMAIVEFFRGFADDLTLPRFQHGNAKVSGAGKTASGLSMLMAASNLDIKDLVKSFDDDITTPFITALYHWNMQFNDNLALKGDFDVVAKGSASLIAKELQSQQLVSIAQITENPRFRHLMKDDELLRELAKSSDITAGLVRTPEEQERFLADEAYRQAKGNVQALVEEFENQGGDKEALLGQLATALSSQLQGLGQQGVQDEEAA